MSDALSEQDLSTALVLLERLSGGFETTPRTLSSEVAEFCSTICESEPVWVPVIAAEDAALGPAAQNVALRIGREGGSPQHGWVIWEHAGLSLAAAFHTVWAAPSGDLVDPTPKPHDETRILFLPDHRYGPDFDAARHPLSRVKWMRGAIRARLRDAGVETVLRQLLATHPPGN